MAALLRAAAGRLDAVTETPRLDAELLLAHALGISRARLLSMLREPAEASGFEELLARRLDHEPLAYIFGEWEFFSLAFTTRAPMLVPRPETEHLVEVALEFLGGEAGGEARLLDVCTGSGCVAVAIAKNALDRQVTATDIGADAVALAKENVARHGLEIDVRQGDLFAALPEDIAKPFDAIVANPPYVEDGEWDTLSPVIRKHEDPNALLAGADGLAFIRRIIAEAPSHLRPGGLLAMEVGETQAETVLALLAEAGFRDGGFRRDLAGIPRVVHALRGG